MINLRSSSCQDPRATLLKAPYGDSLSEALGRFTVWPSRPTWFLSSIMDHQISFNVVNSNDTHAKLLSIADEVTHVFWLTVQALGDKKAIALDVLKSAAINNSILPYHSPEA